MSKQIQIQILYNVSISIRGHDPTMAHSSSVTCWSLFIVRRAHYHSFSEPYGQNVKVNKKRKQGQNTMNVEPAYPQLLGGGPGVTKLYLFGGSAMVSQRSSRKLS